MSDAKQITGVAPGLPNAGNPLRGVATAGQPGEEHLRGLAGAGYRTVVDLRAPGEERGYDEPEAVRRAGMSYVSLPVEPGVPNGAAFERLRALLRDDGVRPALLHCSSANRVGAALVPYLVRDEGLTEEEALRMARSVGLRSPELEREAIECVRASG